MIGRKTALIVANIVVGSVLGFLATKVMALYFGNEASGQYGYALGLLGTLFFITDLGMGQAHIKRVSEGRDPGDCFATFAVFKVVATLAFVLLALAGLFVYMVVLGKPLEDFTPAIFFVLLLYYCGKALQDIGQSSFDARQEAARSQLTILVDTSVRVLLILVGGAIVAALLGHAGPLAGRVDPSHPLLAWIAANRGLALAVATAAGALAAASVSLFMLFRALERGRFRWDLLKDYSTFAFPLFITTTISIIAVNVDSTVLGFFLGQADVGLFLLVKKAPQVLTTLGFAVGTLLLPQFSAMAAAGASREELHALLDRALRYTSIVMVPIVAFLVAFAGPIINIALSANQLQGVWALRILGVWVLFTAFAALHSLLLLGVGRPGTAARLAVVGSVTLIVLDLVLIPKDIRSIGLPLGGLGVVGASIATLVSAIVWWGGLKWANRRELGYREKSRVWRHVVAAAIMTGALLAIDRWVHPLVRFYDVVIYGAVGAAIYLGALLLVRDFHREDVAFLKSVAHPGEMVRYIRGELGTKRR